jgi:hypothetical protein
LSIDSIGLKRENMLFSILEDNTYNEHKFYGPNMHFLPILFFTFGCAQKNTSRTNNYPQEEIEQFMSDCKNSGGSIELCECSIQKISESFPYEDYKKANEEFGPERDRLIVKTAEISTNCLPIEQLHQKIMNGCLQSATPEYCNCYIPNLQAQFTEEELKNIIIKMITDGPPPEFEAAQETAENQCTEFE